MPQLLAAAAEGPAMQEQVCMVIQYVADEVTFYSEDLQVGAGQGCGWHAGAGTGQGKRWEGGQMDAGCCDSSKLDTAPARAGWWLVGSAEGVSRCG